MYAPGTVAILPQSYGSEAIALAVPLRRAGMTVDVVSKRQLKRQIDTAKKQRAYKAVIVHDDGAEFVSMVTGKRYPCSHGEAIAALLDYHRLDEDSDLTDPLADRMSEDDYQGAMANSVALRPCVEEVV